MHLSDEVVGSEHTLHAVGKAEGYSHRQSFGHGDHDERNGNHQRVEGVGYEVGELLVAAVGLEDDDHHCKQQYEVGYYGSCHCLPPPLVELPYYQIEEYGSGYGKRQC